MQLRDHKHNYILELCCVIVIVSVCVCVCVKCIRCACVMHDIKILPVTLFFPQVLSCAAISEWTSEQLCMMWIFEFYVKSLKFVEFYMWPLYSRCIDGQDESLSWITWSNKFASEYWYECDEVQGGTSTFCLKPFTRQFAGYTAIYSLPRVDVTRMT